MRVIRAKVPSWGPYKKGLITTNARVAREDCPILRRSNVHFPENFAYHYQVFRAAEIHKCTYAQYIHILYRDIRIPHEKLSPLKMP